MPKDEDLVGTDDLVVSVVALSERAKHLIGEAMSKGVSPMLLNYLSRVQLAAHDYAQIYARDHEKRLPGGVDICARFFTPEELEDWKRRIDKRLSKSPAYPPGERLALEALYLALDAFHAMLKLIADNATNVLDAAGDVSSGAFEPRLHREG